MTIDPFQVLEKKYSPSAWIVLDSGLMNVRRTEKQEKQVGGHHELEEGDWIGGVEGMAGRLREVWGAAQVSRVNLALLLVEVVARQTEGVVRLAGEAAKRLVLGEVEVSMLAEMAIGKVDQENQQSEGFLQPLQRRLTLKAQCKAIHVCDLLLHQHVLFQIFACSSCS